MKRSIAKPLRYDHQLPAAALRLVAAVEAREKDLARRKFFKEKTRKVKTGPKAKSE